MLALLYRRNYIFGTLLKQMINILLESLIKQRPHFYTKKTGWREPTGIERKVSNKY